MSKMAKLSNLTKSENFQTLKFILITFTGWWIVIHFIAFIGLSVIPIQVGPGNLEWGSSSTDFWLKWANWDGGHFRGIAEIGYIPFQVVFFPLYPLLVKTLMILGSPSLWAGLIISNLSVIFALFYLYKLIIIDFDKNIARKAIFIALAFPTAFYFTAFYSESLFLLLVLSSFYYARRKNWLLAFSIAGLSAATRLTGLIIIIAVSFEYFLNTTRPPSFREIWSNILCRSSLYLFVSAIVLYFLQKLLLNNYLFFWAGLLESVSTFLLTSAFLLLFVYILNFSLRNFDNKKIFTLPALFSFISLIPFFLFSIYLFITQNNFFAYVGHEQKWHRHLTFPWSAPLIYSQNLLTNNIFNIGISDQILIEFLFFIFLCILLVFSYFKLRISYTIFFALSLLVPISTGTLQAIHRYGLVIFPVFIILALLKNEVYSQLWLFFSLTLLGVLTILFINGYWVS